jgi:signal peptidase II
MGFKMLCFLFAALIVTLDQFFKHWIMRTLELREVGPVLIPGVLGLTRWENDGAMLNILAGQQWLLAGIALVAAFALVMILLRYNEGFWGTLGLAAVLGGTIGNLVDRIFNDGYVVDMFRTLFINFPIFNIADIFITLGFITFCIHFIALSFKAGRSAESSVGTADADEFEASDDENAYEQRDSDYVDLPDVDSIIASQSMPEQEPAQYNTPSQQIAPDAVTSVVYEPVKVQEDALDLSFTMEALDALEAELESTDDYNVDALLREYGFEDENN